MFVRAIEGFVGRIIILLGLVLLVGYLAFSLAVEAQTYDAPNWLEGLLFQVKVQTLAAWHWLLSLWYDIRSLLGV